MATLRFYEELNFFLAPEKRKLDLQVRFYRGTTVKKIIEDTGVPHTEVDMVLVNGGSVDFSYQLQGGDRISVYPVFESFDIRGVSKVRPEPLRSTRFILDVHLGKLATSLRMLGFDALYSNTFEDKHLVEVALKESRIILTRDRELLKRRTITHGYFIRSKDALSQLGEVIRRFQLEAEIRPFSRCLRCNLVLESVGKDEIEGKVPPLVLEQYFEFRSCPGCGRVYWKGTHWEHMKSRIENHLQPSR